MAIAFDTANNAGIYTTTPAVTVSHTSTGSNLIGIVVTFASNGDVLTALTWDGVSIIANQIAKKQMGAGGYMYVHYYIAPPTGAKNVVATVSSNSSSRLEMIVSTYTGAKQSGQPDASVSSNGSGLTSISQALTTIADNTWLVMGCSNDTAATFTAGANTSVRSQIGVTALTDSNAAQTPAGSHSQNVTFSSSSAAWIVLSIAPPNTAFARSMSDSIMNGASRTSTIARLAAFKRTPSDSIMNAVSRFAIASKGFVRSMTDSIMNAAGRLSVVSSVYHQIQHYVMAMSDSIMNSRGRYATTKGYLNGLLTTFKAKFTSQGTTFSDKYQKQGTDFEEKYH